MVFSISQHVRDEALLIKFIDYLGCGRIERASTRPDIVNFTVSKFSDIKEKVIPFSKVVPYKG
jgi:thiamine monophosphate synthase